MSLRLWGLDMRYLMLFFLAFPCYADTAALVDANGVVQNTVVLPQDWTGKDGEWQAPGGNVVIRLNGEPIGPGDKIDPATKAVIEKALVLTAQPAPADMNARIETLETYLEALSAAVIAALGLGGLAAFRRRKSQV